MYKYALGVTLACCIVTPVLAGDVPNWSDISKDLKDLKNDYKDLKVDRTDRNIDTAKALEAIAKGEPNKAKMFAADAAAYQKDISADKRDIHADIKDLKHDLTPKGKRGVAYPIKTSLEVSAKPHLEPCLEEGPGSHAI